MEFDKNSVGPVIKDFRLKKGLTQEVASGFADIPRSHWTDIELGNKTPSLATLWKICSALDVPPHEMIMAIENESHPYRGDK